MEPETPYVKDNAKAVIVQCLCSNEIFFFVFWQLNMSGVVEDSNDKHLAPWSEACHRDKIENTPLSPYLDQVSYLQCCTVCGILMKTVSNSVTFLFNISLSEGISNPAIQC